MRKAFAPRQLWLDLNKKREQALKTNDQATAEKAAREALTIAESTFGPEHQDTATTISKLALVLESRKELMAEAESLYRRALAIDEKAYGLEHPKTVASLYNLAKVLKTE